MEKGFKASLASPPKKLDWDYASSRSSQLKLFCCPPPFSGVIFLRSSSTLK